MFKLAVLSALMAVAASSTLPRANVNPLSPTGRIVGGTDVSIDQVPYQVSLRVLTFHTCGASIISAIWVLTAAHCTNLNIALYSIRAGSTLSNSGGSTHSVFVLGNHPSFAINRFGVTSNDISLLRVGTAFELDSVRQPIPLYNVGEEAAVGANAIVTGWGRVTEGGSSSTVLQAVTVPIVSKSSCNSAYSSLGGLPDGQICAAVPEGGKDACQGDSGGPLAIHGRLAGVVSWTNGCAQAGSPGAYTEVAAYRDWIKFLTGI